MSSEAPLSATGEDISGQLYVVLRVPMNERQSLLQELKKKKKDREVKRKSVRT